MNKKWKQFSENLHEKVKEKGIPFSGQFELTARCNLKCKMCYVCEAPNNKRVLSDELTADEWIRLAREARDAGMLYILLTGGEVFLRSDFQRIYENIADLGLRISIYTNGTLITPEIAKWLGKLCPSCIEVSLYGASPETYKRVTGQADAFDKAIRGVDLLLSEGVNTQIKTTVIRDNADDQKKLMEIATKRNLLMRFVLYISPRRDENGNGCGAIRLSPHEISQYEKKANNWFLAERNKILQDCSNSDEINTKNNKTDNTAFKCNVGKSDFWITWNGDMIPCVLMDSPRISVFGRNLSSVWDEMKEICTDIPACGECKQCALKNFCYTCPARLKAETGVFDKISPYLCEWAKYRKENFS